MRHSTISLALGLTLAVAAGVEAQAQTPAPDYPNWKITGQVFGDYYSFVDHHDPKWDGQHGFWIRRGYLTYEHNFSEKLYARFRLEVNGNGQLAGGNMQPFVKDLFLRWQYRGQHQVSAGLVPTLAFDWFETFWGLRHVEKTPVDLYRIDTARDLALGFAGPIGKAGLRYAAQYGSDSGNGAEVDEFKVLRFEARREARQGLVAEAFFSFGERAGDTDRTTAQGIAGWQARNFRVGAQYVHQKRKTGPAMPDVDIDIWSGFGVWQLAPDKANVFARLDGVKSSAAGVKGGLPGADGTDYLSLSPAAPFTLLVGGFEYYLHPSVRIGPNVEWIHYDDSVADVAQDVVARVTFYWSW